MNDDPDIDTLDLRESNRRHDYQAHVVSMDPSVRLFARNMTNVIGRRLTDRDISKYQRRGFYTQEFRDARREIWQKRAARKQKAQERREGNFLVFGDGRKVYSPI